MYVVYLGNSAGRRLGNALAMAAKTGADITLNIRNANLNTGTQLLVYSAIGVGNRETGPVTIPVTDSVGKSKTDSERSSDFISPTDVNECLINNAGCLEICNNTLGSFFCSCFVNRIIDSDGISCVNREANFTNDRTL